MDWLRRLLGSDTWDGSDRRQSLRVRCNFEVQASSTQCSFLAKTRDIGPTGIRIEGRGAFPSSLKAGVLLQIKHLSAPMDCERETVKARVVWVVRKNAGLFQCAAAFDEDVETLRHSWVRSVLAKAIKQAPKQKRKYLRVHCDWTIPAQLNGEALEVRLRDLSLHGARVEVLREICERDTLSLRIKEMKLQCEIRRISKAGGSHLVGVNFRPQAAQQKQLLQLIKTLKKSD
ncbi:PilZ domain-containing protein [bacterium]|nr:PilZ domain-containing protein [bacterium]